MDILAALRKTTESIKNWTTNKISITDARVSNLLNEITNNPDYAATAEVVDIRSGYDGTTYSVAGDAVRAIGNELSDLRVDLRDYIDASAVDGLLYEGNKLYLTYNGEIVSDPVEIIGGSGGGSSTNDAVITLTNTSGWIYKTIANGASCPVSFEWSSLENEIATGSGVLKIIVNGIQKHTSAIQQGSKTLDVSPWLSAGSNTVKINVSDIYGNSRTIAINITSVVLTLTSSFDASTPYIGDITFTYIPTGAAEKTVYFIIDNEEIGTATMTASGRQQTYTIPAQKHGSHTLEVYFTSEIDGTPIESNILYYDLICLEENNTTPIIASDFNKSVIEQYDNVVINYYVYDPSNLTSVVTLYANDIEVSSLTVDRTKQTWTYRADTSGALSLTIVCGAVIKQINLTVAESSTDVEAETDSLILHLSSYGRSNNEDTPDTWSSGDISATFENFNFTSDGWKQDSDGVTALRISGDARLTIPMQIFTQDFRTTGKTIELEFATRDVLNYDAVILSCFSGNRGLEITAQKAMLKSEQSEISTQYKEDEHVRLSFVIQKRAEYRLIMVYINGILSGVNQYPDDDDFSQATPVGISIGSNECTIDLYNIRIYDNSLTRHQILDNWIADTQLSALRNQRWQRNNVFDEYGQIVISQLPKDLPYMVISAAQLPQSKGDKKTVSGYYVDPSDETRNFTFEKAEADVQGTSSAGYARKNYKIKFKNGFVQNGVAIEAYKLRENSVPTSVFTFKADVASSEGANNVELVKLYNDTCPYKTPPQEADSDIRQGIDGYPMIIFQDDGEKVTFIGKYNFNNDKGTPEVFGFTDEDESWEIRNNTSNRVLWKSDDFTSTDWLNDFEARHPEDNTDTSNLSVLASWLKSTDQSAATNATLDNSVTYGEITYNTDSAEYRLAKFKNELADYMEVDSALFYYLFTELFLMVDSRAKNAFPTLYNGDKWSWLPYDMDTAIGTNNEGALVFSYELEDIDHTSTGADVYNGQDSVMWVNLRQAFADELATMYQKLRSDGLLSYEDTEGRFEEHQGKWSEAIFNEDSYYKYLEPLFVDNTAAYLGMLQGSKAEQRKWWLYNRYRYIDSKYNAGDAVKDFITLRGYAKDDITIIPYADIYASIKYGSYLTQTRAFRGNSYTLECPLDNVNDTEIYIYSASQLADVGDLSGLKVGYAEFSMATKLQSLKLGDGSADYSNANLTELYLGNNTLLRTLDVRNCPNLGLGEKQQAVDVSGCTNLEHIYFDGTAISGITLPVGGIIKTLHLPETITNLTIRNQSAITDFSIPNYNKITTLRLENVVDTIDSKQILESIPENSRVRIIGFNWTMDTSEDILSFYDSLDKMRGLDENGNNVDKAQMSGTISVDAVTEQQLEEMQERYPNITIQYNGIKKYTVRFWNGDVLMNTVENINYGSSITYSGATPIYLGVDDPENYKHVGWDKDTSCIVTNLDVYAVFRDARYKTLDILDRTISGNYENMLATKVRDHAFHSCNKLESVNMPNATTIGDSGFSDCSSLKTVDFENVITLGGSAFYNCSALKTVNLPNAVNATGSNIFCGTAITDLTLPSFESYNSWTFAFMHNLERLSLPALQRADTSIARSSTKLKVLDFYSLTTIVGSLTNGNINPELDTVIIRNPNAVCSISSTAFNDTKISTGTGYIYVPAALLAQYQASCATYSAQFRAIEDYPEITGG